MLTNVNNGIYHLAALNNRAIVRVALMLLWRHVGNTNVVDLLRETKCVNGY